jgi:hypothetical protein
MKTKLGMLFLVSTAMITPAAAQQGPQTMALAVVALPTAHVQRPHAVGAYVAEGCWRPGLSPWWCVQYRDGWVVGKLLVPKPHPDRLTAMGVSDAF